MADTSSNEYARAFDHNRGDVTVLANEWSARVRRRVFSIVQGVDADLAENDTVRLCRMYNGDRHVGGKISTDGCGVGVTFDIGDGTTADAFADGADVSGAGSFGIADEVGAGFLDAVTADFDLTLTVLGGSVSAGAIIRGYIDYLRD